MNAEAEDGAGSESDAFLEMMRLTMEGRAALAAGKPIQALSMLKRKHALVLEKWGEESLFSATSGVDLGDALLSCGHYEEGRDVLAWSVGRYRTLGVDDHRLLRAMSAAALAAYQAADYAEAELQYKALLSDLDTRGAEFRSERACELDNLAQVYIRQERSQDAEPLLLEALGIFQEQGNEDDAAVCLAMLGRVYFKTNRFREAEAAQRQALEIEERNHGSESVRVAQGLDHLASCLAMRAQRERRKDLAEEAVALGERATGIFDRGLPATHPSVAFSRQNLAQYKGINASIGMMFPRSDDEVEKLEASVALPAAHPARVIALLEDAHEATMRREYGQARRLIEDAERIAVRACGPANPLIEHVRQRCVEALRRECSFILGEPTGILLPSEHLAMQMRAHARRGLAEDERNASILLEGPERLRLRNCITEALEQVDLLLEAAVIVDGAGRRVGRPGNEWVAGTHTGDALEVLHYARLAGILSTEQAIDRSAQVMQLHGLSGTTISAVSAQGDGPDELAALELRQNVLTERLVRSAMGRMAPDVAASDDASELTQLAGRISELRRQAGRKESSAGAVEILSLTTLQSRLAEHEAAVAYFVSARAIFIVLVRAAGHALVRVEIEEGLVAEVCKSIRESAQLDEAGVHPRYDVFRAGWLFDLTIWPIESFLPGVRHLFICPDGALWSIAFEALCDPAAIGDASTSSECADAYDAENWPARQKRLMSLNELEDDDVLQESWLGTRFTLSTLPSLGLLAQRARARDLRTACLPFLGIGNPTLSVDGEPAWEPIPGAEVLLDGLAKFFHADLERDVLVRGEASVSRVRQLDREGELASRRILCFATHAVYPERDGDILQQGGLVLSGPNGPEILSELDVAQLNLDADLVLLTACYTGAPSGKSFTTPLSGLAQAFFKAGARALLVSTWPVDVHATELLIRNMFTESTPGETLSEALQRAASTVRESRNHRHFAHPMFWAGFSIIGDGEAQLLTE